MTSVADEVLESIGVSLDKSSDDYHLLCFLLLKAKIRSLQACRSRLEHKLEGHTINDILKDLDIANNMPTDQPNFRASFRVSHSILTKNQKIPLNSKRSLKPSGRIDHQDENHEAGLTMNHARIVF